MIALLEGIRDKLVERGVGKKPPIKEEKPSWAIFIGKQPATPTTAVTVKIAAGPDANPKYLLDYPVVQIMIRGEKGEYEAAYNKAQLVKDVLLGIPSQTIKDVRWVLVNLIGDIIDMGTSQEDHPMFSLNFQFIVEPPETEQSNRIPL